MRASVFFLASVLLVGGVVGQPIGGSIGKRNKFGSEATKERPVSKVINLLKDMTAQLEKEGEEDQEVFDAYACWCETNDKEKTKVIAEAEQHTKDLTALIEELTAKSAQLTIDISSLNEAVTKGENSLDEASAVRDKELAEFNQEDKDAIVAIKGLHGAVTTLSKHNAGASLTQEAMLQVRSVLFRHMSMQGSQLRMLGLAPKHQRFIASFLQQPTGATSYNGQSGEIFGVLQAMKESFETNMANSRKEEKQGAEEFATMKKAKTEEVAAANKQLDSKEAGLAEADETNANSKTDLKDTTAQLEADRTFLADLKNRCSKMDAEWAARQQMRQDEVTSIGEALKILTDDDARDLMSRTTNFVQVSTSSASLGRSRAARVLRAAAEKLGKPKLSLLAASMYSDVFGKIKGSIDGMIAQLTQEGKDEVKHKDWCNQELHENDMNMEDKYHEKSNLDTKQADLEAAIKKATEDIAAAKSEIADMQIEMKKAGEAREKESKEFQLVIADARATREVLSKAIAKLQEFYDRKAAFMQVSATRSGQAPPPSFKPYVKAGGGGVIATIQAIIKETRHLEVASITDNNNAQMAYEEFMRDANKSISMLRKEITDKTNQMGKDDADLARTKADLAQNMKDLDGLNAVGEELHANCDFVLKNFEQRQGSRTAEIDALNEAKAMMSQA